MAPFQAVNVAVQGGKSYVLTAAEWARMEAKKALVGRARANVIAAREVFAPPVYGSFVSPSGHVFRTAR